ncbi:PAS domain S-box-containing protein [Sphingomonas zeicaulis]
MNILEVDGHFESILGLTASVLKRRNVLELTHADDRSTNTRWLDLLRAGGAPFSITKRYQRDNGSVVWVTNHVSILREGFSPSRLIATVEVRSPKISRDNGESGWLVAKSFLQIQEQARRLLGREMGSGEPLSILLATYAAEVEGRICDFKWLERAVARPQSVLWRWLHALRQEKLIEGYIPEELNGEVHVQLTSQAFYIMVELLAEKDSDLGIRSGAQSSE